MKYSLAGLMEVIEFQLGIGDIFKFPITNSDYLKIKTHILKSTVGSYEVNKQIEMLNTENIEKLEIYMVVRRLE